MTKYLKLLVSLRNAAATFGEGSQPHESIKTTVQEHLLAMSAKDLKTNLTAYRTFQSGSATGRDADADSLDSPMAALTLDDLELRPKR